MKTLDAPLWGALALSVIAVAVSAIALATQPTPPAPRGAVPIRDEFATAHRALPSAEPAEQPATF